MSSRTFNITNLIVLAHPDDEVGILSFLLNELRNGSMCKVIYLTDGGETKIPGLGYRRLSESLRMFRLLTNTNLINTSDLDYGIRNSILDGKLLDPARDLESVASDIFLTLQDVAVSRIVTPCLEGGHADHDGAFLLGSLLQRDLNKLGQQVEHEVFSLYCASRSILPFSVMKSPPGSTVKRSVKNSFKSLRLTLMIPFIYRSQRLTWLGLWLPIIFKNLKRYSVLFTYSSTPTVPDRFLVSTRNVKRLEEDAWVDLITKYLAKMGGS